MQTLFSINFVFVVAAEKKVSEVICMSTAKLPILGQIKIRIRSVNVDPTVMGTASLGQ